MIAVETGFAGTAHPLDHPRIGAFAWAGTPAASSAAAGFDAAFAAAPETYTAWMPTALPATWEMDFGTARSVSWFGIAAHRLGSAGSTVEYQTWDGADWTTRVTHAPADDSPVFGLVVPRSVTKARLRITGGTPAPVGVIRFGPVTEFPRPAPYAGAVDWADQVVEEFLTPRSEGGHVLGRYVRRRSQEVGLDVMHLSEAWKAATLDPLLKHLRANPCFAALRPDLLPRAVVYGYTAAEVVPERDIPNSAVSVGVSMRISGHAV